MATGSAGIKNALSSTVSGLGGAIAYATLSFPASANQTGEPQTTEVEAQASQLAGLGNALNRVSGGLRSAAQTLTRTAAQAAGAAGTGLSAPGQNVFRVQYNPSSIRFSAAGGGLVPKANYNSQGGAITYGTMDPSINLSITLIFDEVNNQDAFASDKFTLSTTSVARAMSTGVKLAKGKEYSVQPRVEGFIGALRWPEKRKNVKLAWGSLCYEGYLNSVSSKYTMFSPTGNPIRAEVTLNLLTTGTEGNMEAWRQKYAALVPASDTQTGAVTTSNLSGQLTNLLNL
ncbi:MAG: hypothetical protein Q4C65_06865 [Eubacteriales bacterium]|nr:hypothetical protein [Eubacteriales bacterium]